jgi:hypothetical protein
MALIREALDIGAFPSTDAVRRAFEIIERDLLPGAPLPTDQQDDVDKTLQEIRDCIKTPECCKRFRDLLYDMGLFGSARSRRVKAVAATLGIPIEDITECLSKSKDELQQEIDEQITIDLPPFILPEPCADPDAPIDLVTGECLPPERIPEDDIECQPPPLPGAEDTRTFSPFPGALDTDDAAQLCRDASDRLTIAKGTGEILSHTTLGNFLRMFHALAFRPNPPPAAAMKECVQSATAALEDYWTSGIVPPPTNTEQTTLDQIDAQIDKDRDDAEADLNGDLDEIIKLFQTIDRDGITADEAKPWFQFINNAIEKAKALGNQQLIDALIQDSADLTDAIKNKPPTDDRKKREEEFRRIIAPFPIAPV